MKDDNSKAKITLVARYLNTTTYCLKFSTSAFQLPSQLSGVKC